MLELCLRCITYVEVSRDSQLFLSILGYVPWIDQSIPFHVHDAPDAFTAPTDTRVNQCLYNKFVRMHMVKVDYTSFALCRFKLSSNSIEPTAPRDNFGVKPEPKTHW